MKEIIDITPPAVQREQRVDRLKRFARFLDSEWTIPGLDIRIGIDPLIGLIPGIGDTLGALCSSYIILEAARCGASRLTLLRMIGNLTMELAFGAIPIIGDLFDFVWRANQRNITLLERVPLRELPERGGERRLIEVLLLLAFVMIAGLALTTYITVVAIMSLFGR